MHGEKAIRYMNMTAEEKKVVDARLAKVVVDWEALMIKKKAARQRFWTVAGIIAAIIVTAFVVV